MERDIDKEKLEYEYVEHPSHYNHYYLEVIDILERVYGTEATARWCEMTAMKYRLRMGTKPGEPIERDIEKERWYLNKRDELYKKMNMSNTDDKTIDEDSPNIVNGHRENNVIYSMYDTEYNPIVALTNNEYD